MNHNDKLKMKHSGELYAFDECSSNAYTLKSADIKLSIFIH